MTPVAVPQTTTIYFTLTPPTITETSTSFVPTTIYADAILPSSTDKTSSGSSVSSSGSSGESILVQQAVLTANNIVQAGLACKDMTVLVRAACIEASNKILASQVADHVVSGNHKREYDGSASQHCSTGGLEGEVTSC